jgi:predicted metalloprotease with PDZ domain
MFWMHVDLEIRRRSESTRSLDDVLRAVFAAGGSVATRWDVARLAAVAEKATGTTALREIYDDWSGKAVAPDLGALWSSLGVRSDKTERITFDDEAPLAALRRDLTHRSGTVALAATGGPS